MNQGVQQFGAVVCVMLAWSSMEPAGKAEAAQLRAQTPEVAQAHERSEIDVQSEKVVQVGGRPEQIVQISERAEEAVNGERSDNTVQTVKQVIESGPFEKQPVQKLDLATSSSTLDTVRVEASAVEIPPNSEPKGQLAAETVTSGLRSMRMVQRVARADLATFEYLSPSLVHGRKYSAGQRINVLIVDLSKNGTIRVSPADAGKSPVGSWASSVGARAAVNANWYGPFDGPVVSSSQSYGGTDHSYTALFGITANNKTKTEHHRKVNKTVDPAIVEGVAGHPTLIHGGVPTTDFGGDPTFTRRHPRTVIGSDKAGKILYLVTVDGRSSVALGMTGAETVALMQSLGAHDALMLDGGGSTAMWLNDRGVVNNQSDPGRRVGNQIAVFA